MALAKETIIKKVEVIDQWTIQVRTDTVVKEDGVEISRSAHRKSLQPFSSDYKVKVVGNATVPDLDSENNKQWTHTETNISSEASQVQAICNAAWTDDVKNAYKSFIESSG